MARTGEHPTTLPSHWTSAADPYFWVRKAAGRGVYTNLLPPTLAFTTPLANALLNTNYPALTLRYGDSGQGSDPDTLQLRVNDVSLAVSCTATAPELTCTPSTALPEGPVTLSATIEDFAGNLSTPATLALTIDTVAPVITVTTPTAGLVTNQATQTLTGSLSEVATLTLNGQVLYRRGEPHVYLGARLCRLILSHKRPSM